jgi:signal transduction histidine kinase
VALDNAAVYEAMNATRRDLNHARDAERQARAAAEQATQAKVEFLANISHDLRTPLASLHGYLETLLLHADQVSAADRQRYLQNALSQGEKVSRLARELQELAHLESGVVQLDWQSVSVPELVREVLRKLELSASRRSQRLVLSYAPELPKAWVDIGMIERVFTNLLDNALQHAPHGGQVRVEIGHDLGLLWVEVLDTGSGIPPELREGLFARPVAVAQPHRPGGGGLGLLIVHRLLQRHRGEIMLVDRPGFGGAFRFTLPIAPIKVD